MKLSRKFLLTLTCAVLLVVGTALGTLAYFADTDADTNVFTVGKVYIALDEADVDGSQTDPTLDEDKKPVEPARDKKNVYHLIPGSTYTKDPTVHVLANSSDCWVYVKVDNGLSEIEGVPTVADQMKAKGWELISGTTNIYAYKDMVPQSETQTDLVVFESFTIRGDDVDNAEIAKYADKEISVIAYAIQADGFDTAQIAWETANGAFNQG